MQLRDWLEPTGTESQDRLLARPGPSNTKPDDYSATESSDAEEHLTARKKPAAPTILSNIGSPVPVDKKKVDYSKSGSELSKEVQEGVKKSVSSGSSSPPVRPSASKKIKQTASSSSDSDDKVVGPSTRRGTRQPIKRGGRRF
jgi:hypothetical protein